MPALRAAVARHWPDAQREAVSVLGDETLAAEIMEGQSNDPSPTYFADHPPEDHEEVSAVLSRFWRLEPAQQAERRPDSLPTWSRVWWGWRYHWARVLSGAGHTVKLMTPQFVKPYVTSSTNDASDAEAVARVVMGFVPQKSIAQQDLQCLHRLRSRLVGCRTSYIPTEGSVLIRTLPNGKRNNDLLKFFLQ
jgi:hypothetical protein